MSQQQIISEVFACNEAERTSHFLHPEIENIGVDLYVLMKNRKEREIAPYLLRQSFLLYSMDWHFQEGYKYGMGTIPPPPNNFVRENEASFGIMGRNVYPYFASINSFLSSAHSSMNYSVALVSQACNAKSWDWSINWILSKAGKPGLLTHAGQDIVSHYEQAWIWASELRDYRDLMIHNNPVHTQPVITFTTKDRKAYTGFQCLLPNEPGKRRATGAKQTWGKDSVQYCASTRKNVMAFNIGPIQLLIKRIKARETMQDTQ